MGVDDIKDELERKKAEAERKIAVEAGKAAVKTAWKGLVAAVSGLADDILTAGEKELAEARAARGTKEDGAELPEDEPVSEAALDRVRSRSTVSATPSAREQRLARERRAAKEREARKRAHAARGGEDEPALVEPIDDQPRRRTLSGAQREREEREEAAQRELDALKDRHEHPEDRPPVKRTL